MKNATLIALAALAMVFGTGCSKMKSKVGPQIGSPQAPKIGTTNNPSSNNDHWDFGATAALIQTSSAHAATLDDLALYAGFDTNDVQGLALNLDVQAVYNSTANQFQYGGTLKLGYTNRIGTRYTFHELEGDVGTDLYSTQFNHWVQHGYEDYIKMFFETQIGAFLLVGKIDDDLGLLSGRLYFKRHEFERCSYSQTYPWYGCGSPPITFNQDPPRNCWTITRYTNVYDCRTFITSGSSSLPDTSMSIYPNLGRYEEIGRFENLSMNEAGLYYPE